MRIQLRVVGLAVVGLALGGVVTIAFVAFAPAGDVAPHPFNHDRNAVWLEHRWLEKTQAEDETVRLVRSLSQRGVAYAFPHLIPFSKEGGLPPHDREQMRRFLAIARREAPGLRILPWVGGLRVGYKRQRDGTIALADLVQRQRIVAECRGLIDEGFDGVHLNVEPVPDGNVDFLALLRVLRTAVGPGILSVSAIRPGPISLPFAPNFFWTPAYYGRVAGVASQIVVMAYDTALPTAPAYRRYLAWSAETVSDALDESGSESRVLMGVPTYGPRGIMHREGVETPENAFAGIVAGLRGRSGGTFEGVALYAEWTTSEEDWQVYERVWRGRHSR